jgi:peptidoglycan hydrolase-like protein with peptidoglycan-binding domain
MKISDLSTTEQTNEGFGDFINRTGLMGQANKQSAMSKQQDERAKSIGLKDFTYKLNSALQSAIKGGIVTPPVAAANTSNYNLNQNPQQAAKSAALKDKTIAAIQRNIPSNKTVTPESQYKLFNQLIESQILDEAAESVSQFITRFIDTQTRNLVDSPNYQQNINMIAKKLEDQYSKTQKLDSKLVEQVWETIWAWSQLGKKRGGYNSGGQIIDMDHDGTDDSIQRDNVRKKLIQKINKTDFNDPDKLKLLAPDVKNLWDMIQGIK